MFNRDIITVKWNGGDVKAMFNSLLPSDVKEKVVAAYVDYVRSFDVEMRNMLDFVGTKCT